MSKRFWESNKQSKAKPFWLAFAAMWLMLVAVLPVVGAEGDEKADTKEAPAKLPTELTWKTEQVIVFKDGYCLVIKSGKAKSDKAGEVFTDEVPDSAVLGSFWAVPREGRLEGMVAGWKVTEETSTKDLPAREILEILLANQGKQARVELHDKTVLSGKVVEVLAEKSATPVAEPAIANALASLDLRSLSSSMPHVGARSRRVVAASAVSTPTISQTITNYTGANFILRTEEGDVLLQASQVRSVMVKEMQTKIVKEIKTTKRSKRLTFRTNTPNADVGITLMYFRPGVRWIPTYRLDLDPPNAKLPQQVGKNSEGRVTGDKKDAKKEDKEPAKKPSKLAELTLQAEILNEAEDLEEVPISIVVGVPNFRFKDTPSPLVLEATLRNTLNEAAPVIMGQQLALANNFSNGAYTFNSRSGEVQRGAGGAAGGDGGLLNLPGELTAGGTSDLFVYNLPKLTIARGERSAHTIFSTVVPYRDIYTWDVEYAREANETSPAGAGLNSPLKLSKNQVWHQVVLSNTTNVPWTTGAVMIMQGRQPLAQDLLTYTAITDEVRVPVTISVDTRGKFDEKETARDLKALEWAGHRYAKITKEISLSLCNHKQEAVDVEVTLRVGGKVEEATEKGVIQIGAFRPEDWQNYQGHPAVNNSSVIKWKTKLEPSSFFEPKVSYFYFSYYN